MNEALSQWLTEATSTDAESQAVIEQDGRTYLISVTPYEDED